VLVPLPTFGREEHFDIVLVCLWDFRVIYAIFFVGCIVSSAISFRVTGGTIMMAVGARIAIVVLGGFTA